ncbi:hypothetical protein EB796_006374 [Bugula neritina]|uniref:Uncharacterized protein n=1 Tax=Bugula neritina TaxID=10212 RepID=A0A7J7KAV9_BUGNE|nr:hypothetical protein EB796_006374 [Bugula neritina]
MVILLQVPAAASQGRISCSVAELLNNEDYDYYNLASTYINGDIALDRLVAKGARLSFWLRLSSRVILLTVHQISVILIVILIVLACTCSCTCRFFFSYNHNLPYES